MIKQKQQDGNRGRSDSSSVNEGLRSSVLSLQTFTPGKWRECSQGSGNAKGYNIQDPSKVLEEATPARETETPAELAARWTGRSREAALRSPQAGMAFLRCVHLLVSYPCPVRNANKLTGSLSSSWVESLLGVC